MIHNPARLRLLCIAVTLILGNSSCLTICKAQQPLDRPASPTSQTSTSQTPDQRTEVSISGDTFLINGQPTYQGRQWNGHKIEGLLMNSRMVQGIFDDMNPETVTRWAYPDTGKWDAERNTREFVEAMPAWREHGLLAFTLNLQGGSPEGYSKSQPWHNSAITPQGELRPEYLSRLERILERADQLGMVVILGVYYFGQDSRLLDESAVIAGVDNTVDWLHKKGYRNVLLEINNECNVRYKHLILQPDRVHELIVRAKSRQSEGRRLLVGTSYGGGRVPGQNVVDVSDFLLIHGNGQNHPDKITAQVQETRKLIGAKSMPIINNEDDHYDFDQPNNNLVASIREFCSWGYFDFRRRGEAFEQGYQSVPVSWKIDSDRKRAFFQTLKEITGGQ